MSGHVLQNGDEQGRLQAAEQFESLIDQIHESLKPLVVVGEPDGHKDVADHVRNGDGEHRIQIDGFVLVGAQDAQELLDLVHYPVLHLDFAGADV